LQVDNKNTCDHLIDASTKTINYLNGPHGEWMDPQISPWIRSRNLGDSVPTLACDGLITNLPWEQVAHGDFPWIEESSGSSINDHVNSR
jgi:hypothetical protein